MDMLDELVQDVHRGESIVIGRYFNDRVGGDLYNRVHEGYSFGQEQYEEAILDFAMAFVFFCYFFD